jgi:hypothetical protein
MTGQEYYSVLTRFGDYYPLDLHFSVDKITTELEKNYQWVRYNPRKNIERYGLSVTSLDGKMSGTPDLDSFYEYYEKTGIKLTEDLFKNKTEIYHYFSKWLDPFEGMLGRTHIIKLMPGGFFPWHRDTKGSDISSFRLFLPINFSAKSFVFLLEDNLLKFNDGTLYFIDTAKMHSLCNVDPTKVCYFLVANINLSAQSVSTVCSKLTG